MKVVNDNIFVQDEKYVVVLIDKLNKEKVFQVYVPSRIALAEMFLKLSSRYFVYKIEILDQVVPFKDFFNYLNAEKHPSDDLVRGVVPEDLMKGDTILDNLDEEDNEEEAA